VNKKDKLDVQIALSLLKDKSSKNGVHLDNNTLAAFIENSITSQERVDVNKHLTECNQCFQRWLMSSQDMKSLGLCGFADNNVKSNSLFGVTINRVINEVIDNLFEKPLVWLSSITASGLAAAFAIMLVLPQLSFNPNTELDGLYADMNGNYTLGINVENSAKSTPFNIATNINAWDKQQIKVGILAGEKSLTLKHVIDKQTNTKEQSIKAVSCPSDLDCSAKDTLITLGRWIAMQKVYCYSTLSVDEYGKKKMVEIFEEIEHTLPVRYQAYLLQVKHKYISSCS